MTITDIPAPPAPTTSPADRAKVLARMEVWRERLVDLTKGNPLLGLNRARTSKLHVTGPTAGALFDHVVVHNTPLRMPVIRRRPPPPATPADAASADPASTDVPADPASTDVPAESVAEPVQRGAPPARPSTWAIEPGDLTFEGEPGDILRKLRRIRDNARTTVEERGVTTLHLAIGTVAWTDDLLGPSVAPLWLIPCTLVNTGPDTAWRLEPTEDEPVVNPALALYLRQAHKKALPGLPDEPAEGAIATLLAETRRRLGGAWRVEDEAWLSTFSFETLALYADLGALAETAVEHDLVRAFAGATVRETGEGAERLSDDLDDLPVAETVPVPLLAADSSQLAALAHARAGRHVLVYGPPGTGKSQTISNLIADALGHGKKVLFVSAKKAALDVVYDRLKQQGFDRFCLEAHSTTAGKARVIDDLRRTLDAAESLAAAGQEPDVERYTGVRVALNDAVRALHTPREPLGVTIYAGLGRFARLEPVPALRCALPWSDVRTVDRAALQRAEALVAEVQAQVAVFAERERHPWRGCTEADGSLQAQQRLVAALEEVRTTTATVLTAATMLAPFLGPLGVHGWDALGACGQALDALATATWLPAGWATRPRAELETAETLLDTAATQRAALDQATAGFAAKTEGADPLATQELLAQAHERFGGWFSRLLPGYRAWKKQVRETVHPAAEDHATLLELARLAHAAHAATAWLDGHQGVLALVHEPVTLGYPAAADLAAAAAAYGHARAIRQAREQLRVAPLADEPHVVGEDVHGAARLVRGNVPDTREPLQTALATLAQAWPQGFVAQQAPDAGALSEVAGRCQEALDAPTRLAEWVILRDVLERGRAAGLQSFLDALLGAEAGQAVDRFRRLFWLHWTDAQIASAEPLRLFKGETREALIEQFRQAELDVRRATRLAALAGAAVGAVKINEAGYAARGSQLGILRYELQKKRPRPLRRIFADIPHVLQAIKPCLLMSPVSVSTYLATGTFHFDLVVFDEASQLPPAEAIPAILRADQVVVAGDDKQLPPTSFFSSALFAEEADEDEADDARAEVLESLLKDAEAVVPLFQPAHLKWHYRSRDERLIAFSNHAFYDGSLVTFPSPGAPADRGVQLRFQEHGVWDRGKSRTNRAEARATAQVVIEQLERHPERSLGVVALNVSQKEAIEDALEEALADRPDLRARLVDENANEPFFVKSLENVQGDERDVIIISTGYGKDPSGTLSLNFGPLNREGGWRRLNVLVTRAKYLTVLVTSLRSSDLRAVSADNRGVTALRQFIEYAERGGRVAPEDARLTGAETNDFEEAIAAALRGRGLEVEEQVGASSFRIDLAVRDPRDPSWFVLGIECDGATYHSSRSARDRDLLRAEMLRGMGWRLYRIWSVDWFRDPRAATDAAVRAVEQAMALGEPGTGVPAPPPQPTPLDAVADNPIPQSLRPTAARPRQYPAAAPYTKAPADPRDRELLLDPDRMAALADELARIVSYEEPIHPEVLLARAKELNDVARAGNNVRTNFERALAYAKRQRGVHQDQDGVLRLAGLRLEHFRAPSEGERPRDIEHIPAEEIRLALLHVVEAQFGLPDTELVRQAALVMGFEKTSADIRGGIQAVLDALLERGELRRAGFQIVLP